MRDAVYMQDVIDAVTRFFDKSNMEDAEVHKQDMLYELSFVPSVNQLKRCADCQEFDCNGCEWKDMENE